MEITLYYIRGITRLDTPYFANKTAQTKYFESRIVEKYDTGFYPPHYMNEIKIEIDNLINFNTAINYLSLVFNGKTYYYFIDKVEYINEALINLIITMDTIQTYMFDIDFISVDVDRRLINRWNSDDTINRNYLRENYSKGEKIFSYKTTIKPNQYSNGCIIVKTTGRFTNPTSGIQSSLINMNTGSTYTKYSGEGTFLYIFPNIYDLPPNTDMVGVGYLDSDNNIQYGFKLSITRLLDYFRFIFEEQIVLNAYLLPITPFDCETRLIYDDINKTNIMTLIVDNSRVHFDSYDPKSSTYPPVDLCCIFRMNYTIENYKDTITIKGYSITKNTFKNEPFNIRFIPQLIDDNYLSIRLGQKFSYTGLPLFPLDTPVINYSVIADAFTGNITFRFGKYELNDNDRDNYFTSITNSNIEQFALFNDAWKSYLSQNSSTLTRGKALQQQQVLYKTYGNIVGSVGNIGNGIGASILTANPIPALSAMATSARNLIGTGIDLIQSEYVIDEQYAITRENLQFTPDTMKQSNTLTSDIINKALEPTYWLYVVNDIEKVGETMELYGYSVNEHYVNENIIDTLNTRYYYNVIRAHSMEINLKLLSDETTIMNIKDRFKNGIRFWNIDNIELGNVLQYDNVEKAYL